MSPARGESAKQVFVAVAVSLWATLDGLTGIVVACIAAFTQPLIVFVAAAILFIVINTACCTWVDHHWGMWSEGRGKFVEKRLEKMRKGRIMRHPVEWITSGSDRKFAYAAILTNAVVAVTLARIIGGQPVGEKGVRLASVSFSLFAAALFAFIGWAMGDALRAAF